MVQSNAQHCAWRILREPDAGDWTARVAEEAAGNWGRTCLSNKGEVVHHLLQNHKGSPRDSVYAILTAETLNLTLYAALKRTRFKIFAFYCFKKMFHKMAHC